MQSDRFVALDSWRGICALLVALFHVPIIGVMRQVTLVSNGYLFVDFFFVLSGFVIATVYERRLGDADSTWRPMRSTLSPRSGQISPCFTAWARKPS